MGFIERGCVMSRYYIFTVERCWDGVWKQVEFVESNSFQYCNGWLDCIKSLVPHARYRLCKIDTQVQSKEVIREVSAVKKVKVN